MKKPAKRPGKAAAVKRAKGKQELETQQRAFGGFKDRLEALYGIRRDAK
jgi:hypothetical protein